MSPSADRARSAGRGRRDACGTVATGQGRRDACGTMTGQVNGNGMSMHGARHSAGFTLVELLVALAIFLVIMGSMGLLLSGSVRTVNQGYAMMNAMERARGSMSVLEADLKTAFASAEKRQYFQFYGEPNGFMYSGQLVNGGFGRVTYAVHTDNAVPPMQGAGGYETVTISLPWGEVAEQFARAVCPVGPTTGTVPNIDKNDDGLPDITISGVDTSLQTVQMYLQAWNVTDDPNDPLPKNGFAQWAAAVFAQIYPLPAEALADFHLPLDFALRIQRGVLLRYEERGQGTLSEFSDPVMVKLFASSDGVTSLVSPFGSASAANSLLAEFSSETREKLDRLQQDHYWVRMLSGNLPLNNAVDPFAPLPAFWAEDGGTSGKSWRDYVVTEGILTSAELVLPGTDQVITGVDSVRGTAAAISALDMASFFSFGLEDGAERKWFNTLWNMPGVSLPSDVSASPAVRPMFSYFLFGTGTTLVANDAGDFGEALGVQVYSYSPGDPLKPRLPAWVAPGFWVFGDPSRTGAAPFHQWFQQKVDIPSAYLRDNTGI